jgi:hypothetical protein
VIIIIKIRSIKAINFKKMYKKEIIPLSNYNPSILYYNPRYTNIDKKIKCSFSYKKLENYKNKPYIIDKLWRSFDKNSQYKTIRLKSFLNQQLEE